jgi:hypothetical protein
MFRRYEANYQMRASVDYDCGTFGVPLPRLPGHVPPSLVAGDWLLVITTPGHRSTSDVHFDLPRLNEYVKQVPNGEK